LANQDDPADFVVEIGEYVEAKLAAAECHRTQHALFLRRSSQEAGRLLKLREVLMRVESLHRHIPEKTHPLDEPLTRFLIARCLEHVSFCGLD
jgi:LmbE family N-acetylglucosaminyl deacetylase